MGVRYSPSIVTSGLILSLDAANSKSFISGNSTWADLSGNAYNGTLLNGPSFSTDGRGSLSFDGSNDYIGLSSPSNRFAWTPSGAGLNNMTLDIWIKTSDTLGYAISKPWNGSGEYNYQIQHNRYFNLVIGGNSGTWDMGSFADGNWNHIVICLSSTQLTTYKNGNVTVATTNHGFTINTPTYGNTNADLAVMTLYPYGGSWAGDSTYSVSGNVSMYKMYNRALSANEVIQNYRATKNRFGL